MSVNPPCLLARSSIITDTVRFGHKVYRSITTSRHTCVLAAANHGWASQYHQYHHHHLHLASRMDCCARCRRPSPQSLRVKTVAWSRHPRRPHFRCGRRPVLVPSLRCTPAGAARSSYACAVPHAHAGGQRPLRQLISLCTCQGVCAGGCFRGVS